MSTTTKTTITCDECGRTADAVGLTDWWQLERNDLSLDTRRLGDPDAHKRRWDLCSPACVGGWAAKR